MRAILPTFMLVVILGAEAWVFMKSPTFVNAADRMTFTASSSRSSQPDFDSEIKPIFQARCQPCHFQGGKVYDKLPFDKAETIKRLGTKLFTRIKDEKEQQKIREFLEQQ